VNGYPIFKAAPNADRNDWLVPQIEIILRSEDCGECDTCRKDGKKRKEDEACKNPQKDKRSILELAHRSADAVVQSSLGLVDVVRTAFKALRQRGDAGPLCALAPTSLVFGVWDSRGGSGEKRPRLVRAIIRAWDVEPLHAAAQYNSAWKSLSEEQREELKKEEAKKGKKELSEVGLKDAPATFRKTEKIRQFLEGAPNPEARVLGGVLARGRIEREVTVNLIALRGLRGKTPDETRNIQRYLLGLSLVAATADIDLFLREGCNLRYTGEDVWHSVPRRGERNRVDLASDEARTLIKNYAAARAGDFRPGWPEKLEHVFNLQEAKKLLAKKDDENSNEG
jgi:CRISPR-associated protein Csb1